MKYRLTDPNVKAQAERAAEGFPLVPKGKHLMRVMQANHKVVNDNDAIDLELAIVAGEPCEHMQCRDTLFFSEKALGRVLLALSALGMSDAELSAVDPEDESFRKKLMGRTAIVEVEHKKDKQDRIWANPTYAGYKVAHPGSIDELRKIRDAARDGAKAQAGSAGAAAAGEVDYGSVPF